MKKSTRVAAALGLTLLQVILIVLLFLCGRWLLKHFDIFLVLVVGGAILYFLGAWTSHNYDFIKENFS